MSVRVHPTLTRAPHDSDDFFAEITTLMAEGRGAEAYEYKTKWLTFLVGQLSIEEEAMLANIDAELFLRGHIPSARERSHFPQALDPALRRG
jgi:hypothetical protein